MRLFGYEITRAKAAVAPMGLSDWGLTRTGGWVRLITEPFAGAWQRNIAWSTDTVLSFAAVYACVTLIAQDIAKLRLRLVEQDANGIWTEVERDSPYWPVLRKPNRYQNRIRFFEQWVSSKLITGNTYVLKSRDQRGLVKALYVLDPTRVRAVVAPDGSVFYQLNDDNMSGTKAATVPASEIIHDMTVPLFHPLCGVSPITACGLAAYQGLKVQENSAQFFANGSQPGGTLTAPGVISTETAKRLQDDWQANYSGENYGKVAVLGNGLEYKPLTTISAHDAQLIEQLRWTAENVCTAFHVPPFKIGVAPPPAGATVEALNLQYYSQALQNPIESIELCMDEGLGLTDVPGKQMGTEFDLDDLLRMDTPSLVKAGAEAIGSGGVAPNEARKRWFGLGPTPGGEGPYLQQQNFSLAALAKRDALADPFATGELASAPKPPAPADDDTAKRFEAQFEKAMAA